MGARDLQRSQEPDLPVTAIVLGPPGSGKTTQCHRLAAKYGCVLVSPGDVLREEIARATEGGLAAQKAMEQGTAVPPELLITMLRQKLAEPHCQAQGWLLDGFPRTGAQAKAMAQAGLTGNVTLLLTGFEGRSDLLVERCRQRRLDPETGQVYNLASNLAPSSEEVQERLVRGDDAEEKVQGRIKAFEQHAVAIAAAFEDTRRDVDGTSPQGADAVWQAVDHAVAAAAARRRPGQQA